MHLSYLWFTHSKNHFKLFIKDWPSFNAFFLPIRTITNLEISHVFNVGIRAKAEFAYDAEELPEELPELLDEYGSSLVLEEHAIARIVESSKKDEEMEQRAESDEFIIPYEVKMPWGDIKFERSYATKKI